MKPDITHTPTDLAETRLTTRLAYQGSFLRIHADEVRIPSGKTAKREFIEHPGAVVVVPLLDDGRVVLERQYRYPMHRVMVEFPAGKLDPGELPQVCGQRELHEETGYVASEWAVAGVMHNAIAYSDEVIHIHFARGLRLDRQSLDDGEFLEVFALQPAELAQAVLAGQVTDAKTITALYWLDQMLLGRWEPAWQLVKEST